MKLLRNIRYILFALIIFGCFANFAHNEYGMSIVHLSLFALAIAFITEAITGIVKLKSWYMFTESLFISLFAFGWILKSGHWPGWGITIIVSGGTLTMFYIVKGIRIILKERKGNSVIGIYAFFICVGIGMGFTGWIFKLQHWPGARAFLYANILVYPLLISLSIFKYPYAGKKLRLFNYLKTIPGNIRLIFVVFSVIIFYVALSVADIAPQFYSISTPPALEELRIKAVKGGEKEWETFVKYEDGHNRFIKNRYEAGNK